MRASSLFDLIVHILVAAGCISLRLCMNCSSVITIAFAYSLPLGFEGAKLVHVA